MFGTGLVSITFRNMPFDEVIRAAAEAGLKNIEWGSDVHAPNHDINRLHQIVEMQAQYGITCCAYGTYFYLGVTPIDELPDYIRAAKLLGTNILRLWAGNKSPGKWTPEEKKSLFSQCKQAAEIAEAAGVTLCLECHRNTYTEAGESALELMQAVDSPAFQMYWQPNPDASVAENIAYARLLHTYTVHIHTFHWKGNRGYPLAEGADEWKAYLREFSGDHLLLLENMPNHQPGTLLCEADSLRRILEG